MLKEKIARGEPTIGTHVNFAEPSISKIAGRAGYDFVWVDFEHSYMNYETVMAHIYALKSTGTPAVVRVPYNDLTATKKIVDMGPDGIIFPMTRNAQEVKDALDMTIFPPYGKRGIGPLNSNEFGYYPPRDFIDNDRKDLCRFVQIENLEFLDDLDNIMALDNIDGFIFGPADLSFALNDSMNLLGETVTNVITKTVARLKNAGKYVGVSTSDTRESTINHWHSLGIDMLSVGADYDFYRIPLLKNRETLERLHKYRED